MNSQRIEQLKKMMMEEPHDPFYVYAFALEHLLTNKPEARRLMLSVANNHPNYLPVYYQLATLYLETDKVHDAEIILQKGIDLAKEQKDSKALHELQNLLNNLID
jgi:predicted Zn-dependent protease